MRHGVRFAVLGPVRVFMGQREIEVSAVRERTLLAMLVLHANDFVPRDRLIDAIWGDRPPQNARNQVQVCISRLRRRLSHVSAGDLTIVTGPEGYAVRPPPGGSDVLEFRRLLAEARAAAASGEAQAARERYRAALDLWRGPAAAGVESAIVLGAASGLDEERVQAWEERFEMELALGGGAELVPELTDLAGRFPYRERLHCSLLRALCRAGRHADALHAYQGLRQLLRDELGVDPGAELQRLHRAILNRDPMLDSPDGARPFRPGPPVPRQLPAEASCFVGREVELAQLHDVVAPTVAQMRPRSTVVLIYGPGGVGKSALAVRAGHQLTKEFPDGQLYADLAGSTPGMRPLPPVELLGRFLRSLGVPPAEVPVEEAEAVSLFRSTTADRRLLLVLDNAVSRDQVAGLIPSAPGCAVVITSRQPLSALDADARLRLGQLPDPDARALLTGVAAGHTMAPETAQRIVTYTGGLPLALRIAAGRLASRPDLSADEYAARLSDRSRRLDELQLGDVAVRACIRTGYDALPCDGGSVGQLAARAFRALGLLQVPSVAAEVVAAMLDEPNVDDIRVALDRLVDAQLLKPAPNGRYRLHDLVRLVATERATAEDDVTDREQMVDRAVAFYISALWAIESLLNRGRVLPFGSASEMTVDVVPGFRTLEHARDWIDREIRSTVSLLEQIVVSGCGSPMSVVWLSDPIWLHLDVRCDWQMAHRVSELVLAFANQSGDLAVTAWGWLLHGRSEACVGRLVAGATAMRRSLALLRGMGNDIGVALALTGLGIIHSKRRLLSEALSCYHEAFELLQRDSGYLAATVLNNMCVTYVMLNRLEEAEAAVVRACAIGPGRWGYGPALVNLATVRCLRGDPGDALKLIDKGLALYESVGDGMRICEALFTRSEANRQAGDLAVALADAERAASEADAWGYRHVAAAARRQRARILAATGRDEEAARTFRLADQAYATLADASPDLLIEHLLSIGHQSRD